MLSPSWIVYDLDTFAFAPIAIAFVKFSEISVFQPIAVLLSPDSIFDNEKHPIAVLLLLPEIIFFNDWYPNAVLFSQFSNSIIEWFTSAWYPIAVLFLIFIPAFGAFPDKSPINFVAVTVVNEGSVPILVPPDEIVISCDPSNVIPLIFAPGFNFVAVAALPDKSPINFVVAVTVLNEGSVPILVPDDEIVILLDILPSNIVPLIVNVFCSFVAVTALPDKSPINFGAVTIPMEST